MEDESQVMLSYRIAESGAVELGGDGTVPRMRDWLVAQGFSVFVGESSLQGGQDWARTIQSAVDKCEVFVAICSPDYGNTTWTYRELSMADNKKSTAIVPIWHSGRFPPSHVEIILGGTQRVPSGHKCLTQLDDTEWETAMRQLLAAFRTRGCLPKVKLPSPKLALLANASFDEHVPIWPNGERVVEGGDSPKQLGSPKASFVVPISWGLLTGMTQPLRQFLEAEGIRLEVAAQLSEEWGVTTVDDLALIDEEDISKLGLKVIDVKRLRAVLQKAKHPKEAALPVAGGTPPAGVTRSPTAAAAVAAAAAAIRARPPSAGLQRKYMGLTQGARQRRSSVVETISAHTAAMAKVTNSSPVSPSLAQRRSNMVEASCPSAPQMRRPAGGAAASPVSSSASLARKVPEAGLSPAKRRPTEQPLAALRRTSEPNAPPDGGGGSIGCPPARRVTAIVERFTMKGHTGTIASLAFSPDSSMLASGSSQFDRAVKVWSVQHGELRADLIGHGSAVLSVPFSPDNRLLASASKDKTVKLWDVSTVMEGGRTGGYSEKLSAAATLSGHTAEVTGVAYTPDGKQLVSASNDRSLKVWDVSSGACTATLTGHTRSVMAVTISQSEGRVAVSGGADGTVRVWDLRNGRCTRTLVGGHVGGVQSVALTTDGFQLLSSGDDRVVRLYDMRATGPADSQSLKGHTDGVTSVCVIPGLGAAASSSHDKSIRIWDLASCSSIGSLTGHSAAVSCVAAVSDGATLTTLASGSGDETVKLAIVGLAAA